MGLPDTPSTGRGEQDREVAVLDQVRLAGTNTLLVLNKLAMDQEPRRTPRHRQIRRGVPTLA